MLADRYRIGSMLGKGREVYRADDLTLGQSVALKLLPDELAFLLQATRILLPRSPTVPADRPNVCRVYDIAEVDGRRFLSMEYVDGEDLKGLLRRVGRFPQDRHRRSRQLCAGLAAAHDRGVLHRDLKLANVMIDGRGHAPADNRFWLATVIEERDGGTSVVGTPAYTAPKQLERAETSVASDIYSLGLVLYEIFTGETGGQVWFTHWWSKMNRAVALCQQSIRCGSY